MSFSPKDLDESALRQLTAAFASALQSAGLPTQNAGQLFAHVLGHPTADENGDGLGKGDGAGVKPHSPVSPMSDRRVRQHLWRLLSAQMRAGLPMFDAIRNIQARRTDLGFPDGMGEVFADWREMLIQGRGHQDFFVKHVMPFDFKEGAELAINSRLGMFEDAIFVAACD